MTSSLCYHQRLVKYRTTLGSCLFGQQTVCTVPKDLKTDISNSLNMHKDTIGPREQIHSYEGELGNTNKY
eukprot:5188777-Amphidinium_carterae.1